MGPVKSARCRLTWEWDRVMLEQITTIVKWEGRQSRMAMSLAKSYVHRQESLHGNYNLPTSRPMFRPHTVAVVGAAISTAVLGLVEHD
jgi:hypothetical protein